MKNSPKLEKFSAEDNRESEIELVIQIDYFDRD